MDISEILGSLSSENMENLQNMASSIIGGSLNKKTDSQNSAIGFEGIDLNAFSNIASVMSHLGSNDDPRCRLIMSLKPLLSPEKQKRADEAMKILKIIELVPVLRDSGLLKEVL